MWAAAVREVLRVQYAVCVGQHGTYEWIGQQAVCEAGNGR